MSENYGKDVSSTEGNFPNDINSEVGFIHSREYNYISKYMENNRSGENTEKIVKD